MPTRATGSTNGVVQLNADGVTVLIDASAGQMPAITHWGAELPALTADQVAALVRASIPVVGSSTADLPPRPARVPGHHSGWTGRPGLQGSFDGGGWSPRFQTRAVTVDGTPVTGFTASGPAVVQINAVDDTERLRLDLTLELRPGGLLRARAQVTSLSEDRYTLEHLELSFPIPAEATELLDFAGADTLERIPQRGTLRTGTHLRENRKGRTGHDSAYILHAGTPGFRFGYGSIWAVHTAWSGNHRHFADRVYSGEH
jgi:alpha-galactosidase